MKRSAIFFATILLFFDDRAGPHQRLGQGQLGKRPLEEFLPHRQRQ